MSTLSTRALVLLAPGAEEIETTITVDVLRRAGIEVTLAGLDGADAVQCSRDVRILPDIALQQAQLQRPFDIVILPGGATGAERLASSQVVGELLREQQGANRYIAAICAAPFVLAKHNIFAGRKMTCHPSVKEQVAAHAHLVSEPVVEDGYLITSQGPGTAFAFALTLVAKLLGPDKAEEVRKPLMLLL